MNHPNELTISVLDLAWLSYSQTNSDAVHASIALARTAENLGFHRFWFAAHHGLPVSAASQPPILVGAAAAATTRIRVGSGPLLLSNYAPLAVAEQFGTLVALHGDRIDLGLGRSSGGYLSAGANGGAAYASDVADLLKLFEGELAPDRPLSRTVAVPGLGDAPSPWMLGSTSGFSAELAGRLGIPFAYAHHFAPEDTEKVLDLYRRSFRPSRYLDEPRTMVTMMLATGDSREEIAEEMLISEITHLHLLRGTRPSVLTREQAMGTTFSRDERAVLDARKVRQAIGSAGEIEVNVRNLVDATGVDEIMFQTVAATASGRGRSLAAVRKIADRLNGS